MPTSVADNSLVKFLARKRTTFTWLIPLCLAVATWFVGKTNWKFYAAGVVLLVLGEAVRFWAAGTISKDNTVATTGPYGFVRNPLYFGSLLLAVGYGLMCGLGWLGLVVCVVLFAVFHLAAIVCEENFLKGKFGDPYLAYLSHVPRILPRLLPYHGVGDEDGSFSWRQVVYNREPITAIVTTLTAVAFGVLQYLKAAPH